MTMPNTSNIHNIHNTPQDYQCGCCTPVEDEKQALVDAVSIEHFAEHLMAWHQNAKARTEHMLTIPEDTTIMLGDSGDEITLMGDARQGFLAGLIVALQEFGTLPFEEVMHEGAGDTPQPLPN